MMLNIAEVHEVKHAVSPLPDEPCSAHILIERIPNEGYRDWQYDQSVDLQ
jgi:hypothetical protein